MYFKLILTFTLILSLIDHDEICKNYENEKHLWFNRTEFDDAFKKIDENQKDEPFVPNYLYGGVRKEDHFKKFDMSENGRRPIIYYSKELIEIRTNKTLESSTDENIQDKIDKFNLIISKAIEYVENNFLIYSKPIESYTLSLDNRDINFNLIKDCFTGKEKIHLENFDYFIFFDFEESIENGPTAWNYPYFSITKYHNRPLTTLIKVNLAYLNSDDIKYQEVITIVHEILHSFGLVKKNKIEKIMSKLSELDENNKIKLYIQEHNDFYKLYKYLETNDLLEKLYYKTSHFNYDYLYDDLMQPVKNIVKKLTYISAGLLEILTNYEFRVNRKILRKNYDNCLPVLKILFKNNCESENIKNLNNNVFKSLDLSKDIVFNNRCSKNNENIAHDMCDSTFQIKKYCNFDIGDRNPHCYKPYFSGNSNCFDASNNQNSDNFEYYGKKSNCFLIENLHANNVYNPYCLKNEIDLENSRIKIFINNNDEEIELNCEYEKNYDEELEEFIYHKKQNFLTFHINGGYEHKLDCPDMNKFYKNNIPNLCNNDCNLNGRCIGVNTCECYKGFNPEDNCRTKLPSFENQTENRFNYTYIPGEDNSANSTACIKKKNKFFKNNYSFCSKSNENFNLKRVENICQNAFPGCYNIFSQQFLDKVSNKCNEEFRSNKIQQIEESC